MDWIKLLPLLTVLTMLGTGSALTVESCVRMARSMASGVARYAMVVSAIVALGIAIDWWLNAPGFSLGR